MVESQKTRWQDRFCKLDDLEHFEKKMPKIFHALQAIQAYSPLGKQLYDWAEQSGVPFFEEDLGNVMGRAGSMITCHKQNSIALNISVLAHELMHTIQCREYKLLERPKKANIRSYMVHGLNLEAAAVTSQIRVMYEMKLNHQNEAWDDFMSQDSDWKGPTGEKMMPWAKYQPIAKRFDEVYQREIDKGKDVDDALREASHTAHRAYYRSQSLKNTYGNMYLKEYMGMILRGHFKRHGPQEMISEKQALAMATLDDGKTLVDLDEIVLPKTDKELFGTNIRMNQAYDYLECVRLVVSYGEKNNGFQKLLSRLQKEKNPYLGISLNEAIVKINQAAPLKTPMEVMDEMAGLPPLENVSPSFAKASDKKAKSQQPHKPSLQQRLL